MTLEASEISITAEVSNEISVVVDCALSVEATVQVGGVPGASSYDIWLQQPGNAGKTVVEYLESLRGPHGDKGEKGDPGKDATGLGGYPVTLIDLEHGDLLQFDSVGAWVKGTPQSLADGGNF